MYNKIRNKYLKSMQNRHVLHPKSKVTKLFEQLKTQTCQGQRDEERRIHCMYTYYFNRTI